MEHVVSFPSKGNTLAGRLHLPGTGVFPGVVVCHGFKDHKDKPFYVDLAHTLDRIGFAVLRFDFAGSGESEGLFEDISIAQEVADVDHAVAYLRGRHEVDPSRVGVCGISLGGMVAIMQTTFNPAIRAMVCLCPAIDQRRFVERYEREGRVEYHDSYFVLDGFKIKTRFLQDAAIEIYRFAPKLRVPFILIHGDQDQSCLVGYSKQFFHAVRAEKELHILGGAEHMFPNEAHRTFAFTTTADWFTRHL